MKISVQTAQENLEKLIEKAFTSEKILIYLNERDVVKLEPIDESSEVEKQTTA